MAAALSQAWTDFKRDYKNHLSTHVPEGALIGFATSFTINLLAGAVLMSGSASIIPLAFIAGTFSMVASLIDSAIRPLIHLWKVGHINGDERFFDWAGRFFVVMGLTRWVLVKSLPFVGIRLSSFSMEKLVISASVSYLHRYYFFRRNNGGNPNQARVYFSNIVR